MTKVAVFMAALMTGCGLDTNGLGEDDTDVSADVEPDETERDETSPEADAEDTYPPDVEDYFEVDAPEEADGETDGAADEADAESEDAPEDEGGEEDGEADDGGTVDPCAPPEIPAVGLYLWHCIPEPVHTTLRIARWVERLSDLPINWGFEPGCFALDTNTLFCEMTDYGPGSTYYFNVVTFGVGIGWSCGPGLEVNHGVPRIWHDARELEVGVVDNGSGGCNHTFEIAPL